MRPIVNHLIALALRRAGVTAGILAATLLGHVLAGADTRMVPVAPVLWFGVVALAVPVGAVLRPAPQFRAWGPVRLLGTLAAGQASLHVLLDGAPWMFGLVEHHDAPLVSTPMLAVHAAVALGIGALLLFGQRLLVGALAVVRALLAPPRRPAMPRGSTRLGSTARTLGSRAPQRPRSARGPPTPALCPALRGVTPLP